MNNYHFLVFIAHVYIIIICFISDIFALENCTRICNFDDEFDDANTPTAEWTTFSELLEYKTFQDYQITFTCNQTDDTTITINENSDFLWGLRFTIYNKRQDSALKAIDDCICESSDCDTSFKTCLKEVREAMINELNDGFWDLQITEELEKLKEDKLNKECASL